MSKEAMNHAIDVLKDSQDYKMGRAMTVEAVEALEEALAKQEQGEPVAWYQSKDGLPPVGSEVIGGHFYKDTWLKGEPEVFGWGRCTVIADNHPDFHEGKRWITFGPSHNQISHWCWPPQKPSDTEKQQRTWVGLSEEQKRQLNESLNLQDRYPIIDAIEAQCKGNNT